MVRVRQFKGIALRVFVAADLRSVGLRIEDAVDGEQKAKSEVEDRKTVED